MRSGEDCTLAGSSPSPFTTRDCRLAQCESWLGRSLERRLCQLGKSKIRLSGNLTLMESICAAFCNSRILVSFFADRSRSTNHTKEHEIDFVCLPLINLRTICSKYLYFHDTRLECLR